MRTEYEEIAHILAREIDLGKNMDQILSTLARYCGAILGEASMGIWKVYIDKAEAEAYDKVKTITQGQGLNAYGSVYRWFTDVSGLGPAEQARRLMHPEPPQQ